MRFFGGILMHTRLVTAVLAVLAVMALALPMAALPPQTTPAQTATLAQAETMPQSQAAEHASPAKEHEAGGEANLPMPDMSTVKFFNNSIDGSKLLSWGLLFCGFGGLFGLMIYVQLKNLPVHRSMREISELIYETCKTYLITQGKFILVLWAFIGA